MKATALAMLVLLTCSGCLLPTTFQSPDLPAGTYYVEQQNGKTLALGADWVEVPDTAWFEGAGLYQLDQEGQWRLDSVGTAALEDQSLQLNDARPASPVGS